MEHFSIYKSSNDKQEGYRKEPRFSPITHADQPSTSASHEKKRMRPTEEQSAYSDVSIEDVMKTKKQKIDAYYELSTLLERPGQKTLAVSKSETGEPFEIPSEYIDKLMKGALRYFIPKEKKQRIDQQREEKVAAVKEFYTVSAKLETDYQVYRKW
jgi:hypothetical protein